MYKSYISSRTGGERPCNHSNTTAPRSRSFIRRSTALNFVIILVIAGSIVALHRAGRQFIHQTAPEHQSPAAVTDASNAEPFAIHTMVEQDFIEETAVREEAQTALHDAGQVETEEPKHTPEPPSNPPAKKIAADERPSNPPRNAARRGTLHRASGRDRWTEDRMFSVEALDNPQARERYRELNKGLTPEEPRRRPEPEPRRSFTAAENRPSENYEELDSEAARVHYRKQNSRLSKSPIR